VLPNEKSPVKTQNARRPEPKKKDYLNINKKPLAYFGRLI